MYLSKKDLSINNIYNAQVIKIDNYNIYLNLGKFKNKNFITFNPKKVCYLYPLQIMQKY